MKATATTLTIKTANGKKITVLVGFIDFENGREWMINNDDSFTFSTKEQAVKNARILLQNMVNDYELN